MARRTSSFISRQSKDLAIASSQRDSAWSSSLNQARRVHRPSRCVLPRHGDYPERRGPRDPERLSPKGPTRPRRHSDEEALTLRDSGLSYAAVAKSLGFKRAIDAQEAFFRALRKRDHDEQKRLIERETARLDELETRIRDRDAGDPGKMARRLEALAQLRKMLE